MAFTVTNIGATAIAAGATITLPAATIPVGALVIVGVTEDKTPTAGTVADTLNTYTLITSVLNNNTSADGLTQMFYAWNVHPVTNGTVTYTKHATGATTAMTICYSTGLSTTASPLDTAVTSVSHAAATGPTVVSGTPATAGELLLAVIGWTAGNLTSTGANFVSPPATASATGARIGGGGFTQGAAASVTFGPTLSTASPSGLIVAGFKPAIQVHYLSLLGIGV